MRYLLVLSLLVLSAPLWGDDSPRCVSLEATQISCSPSHDHQCESIVYNAEQRGVGYPTCMYAQTISHQLAAGGPVHLHCRAWQPTSHCYGTEQTNCDPSECQTFDPPDCEQHCDQCYPDIRNRQSQYPIIGCAIFHPAACPYGRNSRCGDEPYAGGVICHISGAACMSETIPCPGQDPDAPGYYLVGGNPVLCSAPRPCPRYVDMYGHPSPDPVPGVPPVHIIGPTSCGPDEPVPPVNQTPAPGAECPWQTAFGEVRQNCDPVPCCCQWPAPPNGTCNGVPHCDGSTTQQQCTNYVNWYKDQHPPTGNGTNSTSSTDKKQTRGKKKK